MSNSDFGDDFFDEEPKAKAVSGESIIPQEKKEVVDAVAPQQPQQEQLNQSDTSVENDEINLDFQKTNESPKLIGDSAHPHFIALVERVREQYARLPSLSYEEVYQELSELTIKACPTPTLQVINQELQKSQSAKDRVTELDIQITQCLMLKDRAVDILREAWNKFCDEKSADKRKGDGQYRLANFELDLAKTESLAKACKYVMMNLVSLQDTLSRRITNIQLQIKLMDVGRSSLPDFDFSKKSMDISIDTPSEQFAETREDGTIPAPESDF